MNDFFDAIKSRFSSPILGYLLLTSMALNWRPLFFLLVDSGPVLGRIEYFNGHTSTTSLLLIPAAVSVLVVLSSPWVRYLVTLISSKPHHLVGVLNVEAEHRVLLEKKKYENVMARLLASEEEELIDRAARDQRVDALTDEQTRDRLRQEIEQLRSERDALRTDASRRKGLDLVLSEEALILLAAAAAGDGMIMHHQFLEGSRIQADGKDFMEDNSPRTAARWEAAIKELEMLGYIEDLTGKREVYKVTNRGYSDIEKKLAKGDA